jgi:AraC-like DNA-binding protein
MYRERTPERSLQSHAVCVWQHDLATSSPARPLVIVPDGCVDLLWDGARLRVAGPDTRPAVEQPRVAGTTIVGIRFITGLAQPVLGLPVSALCDQRPELSELWGAPARELADTLGGLSPAHALVRLQQALTMRRASFGPVDTTVSELVRRLAARSCDPELRTATLARELGVSERQLHRRCSAAVGYGPKLLARILRMQAVLTTLRRQPEISLVALASMLGFADQAHLSHDAMELFAQSPGTLRGQAQRRALSVLDKTAAANWDQARVHGTNISIHPRR